jgi:hypothetical protein
MPSAEYARDEISRRGREIYERRVRPELSPADEGRHVVVDVVTGDYAVADSALSAAKTALARRPHAVLFGIRVGSATAFHFASSYLPAL